MAFRSKSAGRALDELTSLSDRHPGHTVVATDNILDMRYFKDLVPALAARPRGPELFYEVKANLKKDQLRLLRAARIRRIQPGIESLSDPVLKLMRKGVDALQNIQLLKWCKELGIEPSWNVLWGFPGEPPGEYERMASLIPLLTHLRPPNCSGMIRLDRFSPNFDDASRLGFEDVTPLPPYRYIYRLPAEALANLAYFFTFRYRQPRDVKGYVARVAAELRRWRRRWPTDDLFSVDTGDCLLLWDLRRVGHAVLTMLRGVDRILYQACDCASDLGRLVEHLEQGAVGRLSPGTVEGRLQPLVERGLLVRDGSRYLALAVPLGEYSPPPPAVERFYDVVRVVGSRIRRGWVVSPHAADRPAGHIAGPSKAARSRGGAPGGPLRRLTVSQFSIDGGGQVLIRRTPPPE
jgi:ribosomal peptide maturation radical SAM protein 1